jgi:hypothetical protein
MPEDGRKVAIRESSFNDPGNKTVYWSFGIVVGDIVELYGTNNVVVHFENNTFFSKCNRASQVLMSTPRWDVKTDKILKYWSLIDNEYSSTKTFSYYDETEKYIGMCYL